MVTLSGIEPEIARFVREVLEEGEALVSALPQPVSIESRRKIAEQTRARWTQGGPQMARTQDLILPGTELRVRIHTPQRCAPRGTLVYLHGGGWTLFSIDTHDRLMREYAGRAGCAVVGLDYSLAPEYRFPQPVEDVLACLTWLRDSHKQLGLPEGKLVVGGDSAGANLALAAALRLRDTVGLLPDGLLLNYAALDTVHRESHSLYDGLPYMLNTDEMDAFWKGYLGAVTTQAPNARPLLADLHGLPPVHLCIAECDILRDENLELERRLRLAGNALNSKLYPGATHSFLEAVSISKLASEAFDDAADWLMKVFRE